MSSPDTHFLSDNFRVESDNVVYTNEEITSHYTYHTTRVVGATVTPIQESFILKTKRHVPKVGVMLVGWGGNNGRYRPIKHLLYCGMS